VERLIEVLEDKVVRPAEAKFNELLARRTKPASRRKYSALIICCPLPATVSATTTGEECSL
jgi:hypothetical protein